VVRGGVQDIMKAGNNIPGKGMKAGNNIPGKGGGQDIMKTGNNIPGKGGGAKILQRGSIPIQRGAKLQ